MRGGRRTLIGIGLLGRIQRDGSERSRQRDRGRLKTLNFLEIIIKRQRHPPIHGGEMCETCRDLGVDGSGDYGREDFKAEQLKI